MHRKMRFVPYEDWQCNGNGLISSSDHHHHHHQHHHHQCDVIVCTLSNVQCGTMCSMYCVGSKTIRLVCYRSIDNAFFIRFVRLTHSSEVPIKLSPLMRQLSTYHSTSPRQQFASFSFELAAFYNKPLIFYFNTQQKLITFRLSMPANELVQANKNGSMFSFYVTIDMNIHTK